MYNTSQGITKSRGRKELMTGDGKCSALTGDDKCSVLTGNGKCSVLTGCTYELFKKKFSA